MSVASSASKWMSIKEAVPNHELSGYLLEFDMGKFVGEICGIGDALPHFRIVFRHGGGDLQ